MLESLWLYELVRGGVEEEEEAQEEPEEGEGEGGEEGE